MRNIDIEICSVENNSLLEELFTKAKDIKLLLSNIFDNKNISVKSFETYGNRRYVRFTVITPDMAEHMITFYEDKIMKNDIMEIVSLVCSKVVKDYTGGGFI